MCACSYKERKLRTPAEPAVTLHISRTDIHGQQVCFIMEEVNLGEREENYIVVSYRLYLWASL